MHAPRSSVIHHSFLSPFDISIHQLFFLDQFGTTITAYLSDCLVSKDTNLDLLCVSLSLQAFIQTRLASLMPVNWNF